ncbi:hypothetical protein BCR39DRAFT_545622 [Naematelia encephala]|uniref:Uncharacterized protein n=1 Tax=Naematelia encephala TaxID=71784 RepID=A0A1Y2AQQ9_9TREE|nr:hypothetical protein BCR39DRAFT_545622 [Naematelia encephala]
MAPSIPVGSKSSSSSVRTLCTQMIGGKASKYLGLRSADDLAPLTSGASSSIYAISKTSAHEAETTTSVAQEIPLDIWRMVVDAVCHPEYLASPSGRKTLHSLQTVCKTLQALSQSEFDKQFPPIWQVSQATSDVWSNGWYSAIQSTARFSPARASTITSLLVRPRYTWRSRRVGSSNERNEPKTEPSTDSLSVPAVWRFTTLVVVPRTLTDLSRALQSDYFREIVLHCRSIKSFVIDGREMESYRKGMDNPLSQRLLRTVLWADPVATKIVIRVNEVSLCRLLVNWHDYGPKTVTTIQVVFSAPRVDGKDTYLNIEETAFTLAKTLLENDVKLHLETTGKTAYTERDATSTFVDLSLIKSHTSQPHTLFHIPSQGRALPRSKGKATWQRP